MKMLIVLFSILPNLVCFGQAPVLDSNYMPRPGTVYEIFRVNPISEPYIGANVIWDYSRFIFQTPANEISFNYPDTSFDCQDPNVNIIEGNKTDIDYECGYQHNNEYFYTEEHQFLEANGKYHQNVIYSKPQIEIPNLKFGQTITDTSYYIVHYSDWDSVSRGRNYTTFSYIGYGKLILGPYTFDSVIAVHIFINNKDSDYTDTVPWKIQPWYEYNYIEFTNFYSPQNHYLIASEGHDGIVNNGDMRTFDYWGSISLLKSIYTSKQPPVTTHSKIKVSLHDNKILISSAEPFGMSDYELLGIDGKMILKGNAILNSEAAISIPDVSTGVYILSVENEKKERSNYKLFKY